MNNFYFILHNITSKNTKLSHTTDARWSWGFEDIFFHHLEVFLVGFTYDLSLFFPSDFFFGGDSIIYLEIL